MDKIDIKVIIKRIVRRWTEFDRMFNDKMSNYVADAVYYIFYVILLGLSRISMILYIIMIFCAYLVDVIFNKIRDKRNN